MAEVLPSKRCESRRSHQTRKRPGGCAANKWGGILRKKAAVRNQRWVTRISGSNQHVADETVPADPLDRGTREEAAKARIVEFEQFGQVRLREVVARGELHFRG